jgi:ADP-ribose pyrophosphatase YjhB (NUDIX family)
MDRVPQTVVCVGAVVRHGDRILLVRQSPGHPLAGQWTVPWGRLEAGESPGGAALREVREEGGVDAMIEGLLGVQVLPPPWPGWIGLVYLCRHVDGVPAPQDVETDAAAYFSLQELNGLKEPMEPWSDWLVRRVFAGRFTLTAGDPSNPLQHPDTCL